MSKIGIIIRALPIGGAEKQCLLLASELQKKYDVHLFIQKSSPLSDKYYDFIKSHQIKHTFLQGNLFRRYRQLNRQLKQNNYQILLSYLPLDNLLSAMLKLNNKGLIVAGGIRSSQLSKAKFIINRFLHRHIHDYTIFNNYSGLNGFLQKGFIKQKSFVVHNSIDLQEKEKVLTLHGPITIISVSRFQKMKDHYTALKAIRFLREKIDPGRSFKYLLIGYGPEKKSILRWIDQLEISEFVEVVESPPNVNEYFQNAHIYLSTSVYEGFSNSIMEALNYSLAVISSDVGDSHYLIKNNENGFLVRPGDYKEIAKHLEYFVSNPEKIEEFGQNGYRHLHANFSPDIFTKKYIELIHQMKQNHND